MTSPRIIILLLSCISLTAKGSEEVQNALRQRPTDGELFLEFTQKQFNSLRHTPKQPEIQQGESYPRQNVIRRIYHDNPQVRKNVREVEERSERSRTGFLGDPNHNVPYENHPYDPEVRRRMQLSNSTSAEFALGNYRRMRIMFETYALDARRDANNAAKINDKL